VRQSICEKGQHNFEMRNADAYAGGFIVEGKQISGSFLKCRATNCKMKVPRSIQLLLMRRTYQGSIQRKNRQCSLRTLILMKPRSKRAFEQSQTSRLIGITSAPPLGIRGHFGAQIV
jgi:hypothetical protein